MEENFNWEDDLMSNSLKRQESHLAKLAKDKGKDYGKPIQGSESDLRSKAYQKQVINEVINICHMISEFGQRTKDGAEYITFGELFRISENISNKCVGILQRGRKYRLLHFSGETLWQGADDKKIVTLIRKNREIQVYYEYTKQLLPNNPEGNHWIEATGPRRAHYDWVTNVKEINPTTTAYCVQVNTPEYDDSHDLPARCFPLTHEEEIPTRPNYLVEPKVVFKLATPVVILPPIVLNQPMEFFDPCLWFDTSDIPALPATETALIQKEEARPSMKYTITRADTRKMKEPTPPPRKIKPFTPPPPRKIKPITPPPPPRKVTPPPPRKVMVKIEKPVEKVIAPVVMRPVKIKFEEEYRKSSIKFNNCTTMYKPPDPVYEHVKRAQPRPASMSFTPLVNSKSSKSLSFTPSSLSFTPSSLSVSSTSTERSSLSRSRSVSTTHTSPAVLQSKSLGYRRMSTELPGNLRTAQAPNSRFNFG